MEYGVDDGASYVFCFLPISNPAFIQVCLKSSCSLYSMRDHGSLKGPPEMKGVIVVLLPCEPFAISISLHFPVYRLYS